jgi:serine/threonine protein kinase
MGMVFAAVDERLEREVAIKVVRSEHFDNHLVRLRFEKEARAVARVEHPGVVSVFDCGELDDGAQYLVMELLVGASLRTLIDRCGPGTPRQVARLLRQAGAALSAAHRAGIVHRDIKPDNIFLVASENDDDFDVRILDFGVAKEMDVATNLTQTGMLVGTPLFMSPEQLLGHPVDFRSDVYSFAAVGFLALTGRRVTLEKELVEVVLDVTQNDAPTVSEVFEGMPLVIDRAFAWALSREADERPSCAETWAISFAEALEAVPPKVAGWGKGRLATSAECAPEGLDELLETGAETRMERIEGSGPTERR